MRKICYLLAAAVLVPFLQGCPKPAPKIKEDYEVNKWVYSQMSKYYLWIDSIPSFDDSGAELVGTQEYFDNNLRYRVNRRLPYDEDRYGDRFSKIEFTGKSNALTRSRTVVTEKEYNFGFLLSRIVSRSEGSLLHLQVLYVNPGAPADKAGVKRGDTFDTVNGTKVTNENLESLLSGQSIKITVLNRDPEVEITIRKGYYYDNPILLDTVYQDIEPRTAYLVYNHFTNGDDVAGYANKLKAIFAKYKSEGVENLILDLRYNGGGEVGNAELLASLIAPAEMLGKEFMRMQRNASTNPLDDSDWNGFSKYYLENLSQNADIKNLYIITSRNTASASELIIHTMRPIFRDAARTIYTVGQTTYGKNLGSFTYTNSRYEWEISPICMRVYNLDRVSGYEEGLFPDTGNRNNTDDEYLDLGGGYYTLPPLGDYEHEYLLNMIFSRFYDIPAIVRSAAETRSGDMPSPVPMVPQRGLSGGTVLID